MTYKASSYRPCADPDGLLLEIRMRIDTEIEIKVDMEMERDSDGDGDPDRSGDRDRGVGQGGTLIETEIQIRGFYLHLRLYFAPLPLD